MKLRVALGWLLLSTASITIVFDMVMKVSASHWWTIVLAYVVVSIVAAAQLAGSLLFFLEAEALA